MSKFRGEDPFVTIIHIGQLIYTNDGDQSAPKQAHEGVMMTLMQFRSLMFHLQALNAQFMQGSEMRLTSPCKNGTKHIGEKRTWNEVENDDDDPARKTCKQDQVDVVAWNEMNDILSSLGESSNAASKSSDVQESLSNIPKPILSKKKKCVMN